MVAKHWRSPKHKQFICTEIHADEDGRFTWNGDKKARSIVLDTAYSSDGWTVTVEGSDKVKTLFPGVPYYLPHTKGRLFSRDSEGRGNLFLVVTTIPYEQDDPLYHFGELRQVESEDSSL